MISLDSIYRTRLSIALGLGMAVAALAETEPQPERKRLVLIAGQKSHGPEGNRIHDYPWSVRLLKATLENSSFRDQIEVVDHYNGWPTDSAVFEAADAIIVISDGRDGAIGQEAPHLATPEAQAQVQRVLDGGGGLIAFHFATFAPDALSAKVLDWVGGYFDWETDGARAWYSNIETLTATVEPTTPTHPINNGVQPFSLHEEFYFDMRFAPEDPEWVPIWSVSALPAQRDRGTTVAWAVERANGARGFATTCGHFYDNWKEEEFRKTMLNAVVWAVGLEVPDTGVESSFMSRTDIAAHFERPEWVPSAFEDEATPYDDEPYWYQPGHPVEPADPDAIEAPDGFEVEKVLDAPEEAGSWTALARDPQGRLYLAAQHRPGIWRLAPPPLDAPDSQPRLERLGGSASAMGWSHGLLVGFDSLYVTVSEGNDSTPTGLYRLRDTDGDDQFDTKERLFALDASGEHGPHNLVVGPDRASLYFICGNGTPVPDDVDRRLPIGVEGIDRLMPPGYESPHHTDAGWVMRLRPDGSERVIVASGLRNAYDLAFNAQGDLFTYDSDMEWDLGAPWYRPTRICHVVPGAEFGWRGDAAKWPPAYPDSVPGVVDIGPGSPTGITFGYQTAFPEPYRRALFSCDWTFATIYAVELSPEGSTFKGVATPFVGGPGLPVTDIVDAGDGALYFTVGGRRLGSALYRIVYRGPSTEKIVAAEAPFPPPTPEALLRQELEQQLEAPKTSALDDALRHLDHSDRGVRYAARTLLEGFPVDRWRDRILDAGIESGNAALALARQSDRREDWMAILQGFSAYEFADSDEGEQQATLRALEHALAKAGAVSGEFRAALARRMSLAFPTGNSAVDRELARLICYLDGTPAIPRLLTEMARDEGSLPAAIGARVFTRNPKYGEAVGSMLQAAPMMTRMSYAQALLWSIEDMSLLQQSNYFLTIDDALQRSRGGYQYREMWERIREVALDHVPESERSRFAENPSVDEFAGRPTPDGPGEAWTVDALVTLVDSGLQGRNFEYGASRFQAANCADCHALGAPGPAIGPDLSEVGRRFTVRDLIQAIVEPNAAISDQYRIETLELSDGGLLSGRIVAADSESVTVAPNILRPSQTTRIAAERIVSRASLPLSTMPAGLLDPLNQEEVLDLLAYILSGGSPQHEVFR